jgi:hypothetical protein
MIGGVELPDAVYVGLVFVPRNDLGLAVFSNAAMMPHFSGEWLIQGLVLHPWTVMIHNL